MYYIRIYQCCTYHINKKIHHSPVEKGEQKYAPMLVEVVPSVNFSNPKAFVGFQNCNKGSSKKLTEVCEFLVVTLSGVLS